MSESSPPISASEQLPQSLKMHMGLTNPQGELLENPENSPYDLNLIGQVIQALGNTPEIRQVALDQVSTRLLSLVDSRQPVQVNTLPLGNGMTAINVTETQKVLAQEEQATIDPLTGLENRRSMERTLEMNISDALRTNAPLTVIMMDIDHFKKVNDTYGHDAGDAVIRAFSGAITRNIRQTDKAARYGGEEFLLQLLNTNIEGAQILAEQLRTRVAASPVSVSSGEVAITSSFGIASLPEGINFNILANDTRIQAIGLEGQKIIDYLKQYLVSQADTGLYTSKRNGRNQVNVNETSSDGFISFAQNTKRREDEQEMLEKLKNHQS